MNKEIDKKIEATEEIEETKTKKNIFSRGVNWVKTNGKKIAAGAAVIGVGVLGYALGKKSSGDEVDYDYEELENIEDYSEVDPE